MTGISCCFLRHPKLEVVIAGEKQFDLSAICWILKKFRFKKQDQPKLVDVPQKYSLEEAAQTIVKN